MNMNAFPINLYKSNIELQLRIMQPMQDSRQRWLEFAQPVKSQNTTKRGLTL